MTCARYKCFDHLELNLVGHSDSVTSVSWSQDGNQDAANGELLNTLEGHSERVPSVSWNHDDSKIASGSYDETICSEWRIIEYTHSFWKGLLQYHGVMMGGKLYQAVIIPLRYGTR
jgi:hypothetical protein